MQECLDLAGDRGGPEGVFEAQVDDGFEDGDQALVGERLAAAKEDRGGALRRNTIKSASSLPNELE